MRSGPATTVVLLMAAAALAAFPAAESCAHPVTNVTAIPQPAAQGVWLRVNMSEFSYLYFEYLSSNQTGKRTKVCSDCGGQHCQIVPPVNLYDFGFRFQTVSLKSEGAEFYPTLFVLIESEGVASYNVSGLRDVKACSCPRVSPFSEKRLCDCDRDGQAVCFQGFKAPPACNETDGNYVRQVDACKGGCLINQSDPMEWMTLYADFTPGDVKHFLSRNASFEFSLGAPVVWGDPQQIAPQASILPSQKKRMCTTKASRAFYQRIGTHAGALELQRSHHHPMIDFDQFASGQLAVNVSNSVTLMACPSDTSPSRVLPLFQFSAFPDMSIQISLAATLQQLTDVEVLSTSNSGEKYWSMTSSGPFCDALLVDIICDQGTFNTTLTSVFATGDAPVVPNILMHPPANGSARVTTILPLEQSLALRNLTFYKAKGGAEARAALGNTPLLKEWVKSGDAKVVQAMKVCNTTACLWSFMEDVEAQSPIWFGCLADYGDKALLACKVDGFSKPTPSPPPAPPKSHAGPIVAITVASVLVVGGLAAAFVIYRRQRGAGGDGADGEKARLVL